MLVSLSLYARDICSLHKKIKVKIKIREISLYYAVTYLDFTYTRWSILEGLLSAWYDLGLLFLKLYDFKQIL